jgi:hypothetical protein
MWLVIDPSDEQAMADRVADFGPYADLPPRPVLSRPVPADGVPTSAPSVVWEELDGECVLYDEARDELHRLNGTASVVWQLCDGTTTVEQLVGELADAYGAPREVIEGDVTTLLGELAMQGLLDRIALWPGVGPDALDAGEVIVVTGAPRERYELVAPDF